MKEIGGYFELEVPKKKEYHSKAIHLNSARNALKFILKAQHISKIYIPYYICNTVLEVINDLKIEYEYYTIDSSFEIISYIEVHQNEKFLYVNYFGLKSAYIKELVEEFSDGLIIDNAQAFFHMPVEKIDTYYSPRKFFGVSQGGYLYTNTILDQMLEEDYVDEDAFYLIGRADSTASQFFKKFRSSESSLSHRPIKMMSKFTHKILMSIDYKSAKMKRERNFLYLHSHLHEINDLTIDLSALHGPMIYPLLLEAKGLRQYLIDNKVYVAVYWQEVLDRCEIGSVEEKFTRYLLPLPIDQRYELTEMEKIIQLIKKYNRVAT